MGEFSHTLLQPSNYPRPAQVDEQQAALVVGALADAPARGAGEQLDGVPGDEAEHGRLGTACQDQAGGLTAVHLRERRGGPRGRVDDLLVAGGWRPAIRALAIR